MSDAEFPPNFAVITAAAVAVGHTIQIMKDSSSTRCTRERGVIYAKASEEAIKGNI